MATFFFMHIVQSEHVLARDIVMANNPFAQAKFVLGAMSLSQLPPDDGQEVAFIGRSNVGKSTALNALTDQKKLAKTSKTPGRTQQINVFEFAPGQRLIDLPGFGYAKVSNKMRQHWQGVLNQYLEKRQSLSGLILLVDARRGLQDTEELILKWASVAQLRCHILLTKADKLSQQAVHRAMQQVEKTCMAHQLDLTKITRQSCSMLKKTGLNTLKQTLLTWFCLEGS